MATYRPSYQQSRALVVGINEYDSVSKLSFAVNDAQAVAGLLCEGFGFAEEHVQVLLDAEATKEKITRAFLRLTEPDVHPDDRMVFFYAGHGYTRPGLKGEVGFLVPVGGTLEDIASLIRWDELTKNVDLVPAKHILFVMDACYGGLAITRALAPGSTRFLQDMLQRPARQVLTAGKANETVSDAGGPLPNHSVFTGHLLEGLQGKAATPEGIVTANSVMSYVYSRVALDPDSQQTPHYGYLQGDGDLIFTELPVPEATGTRDEDADEPGQDTLLSLPSAAAPPEGSTHDLVTRTKELLSEDRHAIALDDLLMRESRDLLGATAAEFFPAQGTWSPGEFRDRLGRYEEASRRLVAILTCIGHWGKDGHRGALERALVRLADHLQPESGLTVWISLRAYPLMLMAYAAGIAAATRSNAQMLATILRAQIPSTRTQSGLVGLAEGIGSLAAEVHDAFKTVPGHERHHVPRSEYLLGWLQPQVDDILFLGRDYEARFDRFEVLLALECASHHDWGPPGRFAWKYQHSAGQDPFNQVVAEGRKAQGDWPLLREGLFDGSYERFDETATAYEERLKNLGWW